MNWRKQCRARYQQAFDECVSTLAPLRRPHTSMGLLSLQFEEQQRAYERSRCGHARIEASASEIEIASCPSYDTCSQQFRLCVRAMTAANARGIEADPYQEPAREMAPAPQVRQPDPAGNGNFSEIMAHAKANRAETEKRPQGAFLSATSGDIAGVKASFGRGLTVNMSDKERNTLLHAAVMNLGEQPDDNISMMHWLIEQGIQVGLTNAERLSALHVAMERRIGIQNYARSGEFGLAEPYCSDVLYLLVDAATHLPNKPGSGELTLLHFAVLDHDAKLVEKLLKRMRRIATKDDFVRTAYDIARGKSQALAALFPPGETRSEAPRPVVARYTVSNKRPVPEPLSDPVTRPAAKPDNAQPPSPCLDLRAIPEGDRARYSEMAKSGAVKLCDVKLVAQR